ncbi:acyltransferase [Naasia sp. SYSU D00948]|uniref:acyltransferase family protein n=1 Tax=Naasia sp. SYSU D00948 TaxID=2817379 RepID=UPI001B316043|nr:acyltransferase [Naasia sp. SYSU D00948]
MNRTGSVAHSDGGPVGALGRVFDPRLNGLNLLRLILAAGVIFWHAFPLTGREIGFWPARQLLGEIWVDGFFAISGFLIVGSWVSKPRVGRFLTARIARILPGFWVCLVVTALLLAPLGVWLSGGSLPGAYGPDAIAYFFRNSLLYMNQWDIAGTPALVPYEGVWNGSLWTLFWEFLCYLGVLALGVLQLLKRRWTIPVVFLLALAAAVASVSGIENHYVGLAGRFALMFAAGAVLYRFQHRIPVRGWIIGVAAVVVLASTFLPNYRLVAAIPLAYVLLACGALIKDERLRMRNDISYGTYVYAFPVQQILAGTALVAWSPLLFGVISVVLTIPLAIASWFLVEKPAKRLAQPRRQPRPAPAVQPAGEQLG